MMPSSYCDSLTNHLENTGGTDNLLHQFTKLSMCTLVSVSLLITYWILLKKKNAAISGIKLRTSM